MHLAAAAKHPLAPKGARKELAGPGCPPAAEHVWTWFRALDAGRGSSGFGPSPISWLEIEAYFRLHKIEATATELEWLRMLDKAAIAAATEAKP